MNKHRHNRLTIAIVCVSILVLCGAIAAFAQEKQKNLMESYIGKWYGEATIQNINMSGGWGGGFLGIHVTTRDILQVKFNLKFLHPLDDPLVVEEYKKAGISVDHFKNLKNMMLTSLSITGNAAISGFSEYTHETREYCEECKGEDGTRKKDFPEILIPVSGGINLAKNERSIRFGDLPKEYNVGLSYWFSSENVKLVESNKIVLSYKRFEEHEIDQNLTGELHRMDMLKKIFPIDIKPNEPIKTDKKTQLEIIMPSKEVIKVAQNTEAVIRSESLMEVVKGKIHGLIKKLKPKTKFDIRTPTATTGVRGTEYALSVEDDGTTTVVVLEGEIEFSDKENKKTVIVKKNQKSVVKPGALPTVPEGIDPENILKWWK